jgi:4-amino-4-deoxy-L-arabinose transferase-like glycosyltransferase
MQSISNLNLSSIIKHESINWVEWLILTGFVIYFLFFLFHAGICLMYPNDLDNEEGFILNQIRQLRTGHTIYPALNDYPYTVGNYPPVYPLLCTPFTFFFGEIHFIGRFISILSILLTGYLIYRITYQLTGEKYSAILSGLFPFSVHYVYRWAVYNRVDMLALLFSLWGLYLIFRQSKPVWVAALLFLLGIYTKPVMVAAPIAAFLYLWTINRKNAGLFILEFISNLLLMGNFINISLFTIPIHFTGEMFGIM